MALRRGSAGGRKGLQLAVVVNLGSSGGNQQVCATHVLQKYPSETWVGAVPALFQATSRGGAHPDASIIILETRTGWAVPQFVHTFPLFG